MSILHAETRRSWSRSTRTSFWLAALRIWTRCNGRPTIPIVFAGLTDPVGAGFVESLARPGGNTTGFISFEYGLSAKWVELLKEIAPRVTRVGVLREQGASVGIGLWAAMQGAAPSLGIELRPIGAREASDIERGVAAFAREPNGGLIVTVGGIAIRHRDLISTLAARHRLPAVSVPLFRHQRRFAVLRSGP
jgi:putative ABC transport system substrate-binding protein